MFLSSDVYATNSVGSVLLANRDITLSAREEINQTGSAVISEAGDISYTAGSDVNITAGKNTYSEDSKSSEKTYSVTGGTSGGFGGSFGTSRDWSKADEVSWVNSVILAENGNVSINTNEDVTVRGGNIYGDTVDIEAENLTIESLQNTINNKSGGHGFNVGLTVNTGPLWTKSPDNSGLVGTMESVSNSKVPSGQVGFSERSGYHDAAWVEDQSSIVSNGEMLVNVKDKTELIGGVIGSETGEMTLSTGELVYEDIEDHNYSRNKSTSVNTSTGSVNPIETILSPSGETTISKSDEGEKKDQITKATIGEGTIIINGEEQDNDSEALEGLNRDLDATQVITRDEKTGGLNYTITVDHAIAAKAITIVGSEALKIGVEVLDSIGIMDPDSRLNFFSSSAGANPQTIIDGLAADLDADGRKIDENAISPQEFARQYEDLKDNRQQIKELDAKIAGCSFLCKLFGNDKKYQAQKDSLVLEQANIVSNMQSDPYYRVKKDEKDAAILARVRAYVTEDGKTMEDIRSNWDGYTRDEQLAIAQKYKEIMEDEYGITKPPSFTDEGPLGRNPGGHFDPVNNSVYLNLVRDSALEFLYDMPGKDFPTFLGTLGEEMTHASQYQMVDELRDRTLGDRGLIRQSNIFKVDLERMDYFKRNSEINAPKSRDSTMLEFDAGRTNNYLKTNTR
ncbi:hemagluttinin repeat-containing protein [Parelusimicrobium proximum]|uniref:hemagglutinin repeat-containing protein n=1 Tax=Parelusimicrobium proximum TaxID=3228953 RepID=UPI003D1713D9